MNDKIKEVIEEAPDKAGKVTFNAEGDCSVYATKVVTTKWESGRQDVQVHLPKLEMFSKKLELLKGLQPQAIND